LSAASSAVGLSRRKKRISGRAFGSFTQSSSKNSVRVNWLVDGGGKVAAGEGTTRTRIATAALRGSVKGGEPGWVSGNKAKKYGLEERRLREGELNEFDGERGRVGER
jgi:hypothetical protein